MGMYCGLYRISSTDVDSLSKNTDSVLNLLSTEPSNGSYLSLEKSWHGLHYLLNGTSYEGSLPLSFIMCGGNPIGSDGGYGPSRLLTREFVKEIDAALRDITIDDLWVRFSPDGLREAAIYPDIWDEPEEDLKDEYGMYFNDLKNFMAAASEADESIIIAIT